MKSQGLTIWAASSSEGRVYALLCTDGRRSSHIRFFSNPAYRNILYSIVCNLRRQKDAIARGLIKEGYFGGQFVVRMKDGREHGFYYTPFNAEAFGEAVSHFENLKKEKIKEIAEVLPKVQV